MKKVVRISEIIDPCGELIQGVTTKIYIKKLIRWNLKHHYSIYTIKTTAIVPGILYGGRVAAIASRENKFVPIIKTYFKYYN